MALPLHLPVQTDRVTKAYYSLVTAIDDEMAKLPGLEPLALLVRLHDTLVARLDGEEEEAAQRSARTPRKKS